MRKVLMILALAVITVVASADDAFAQRGGFGGGRGGYGGYGGGFGGGGFGYGRGSSLGIFSIGNGRGGYYGGNNYGSGYYNPGYYGQNYYGSSYYSTPQSYGSQYYYTDPIAQVPYTQIRQSSYIEPAASLQNATMVVLLPKADATVWFDGSATSQQGMERSYYSPPLDPNGTYSYTIRARWMENGQTVDRERRVNVQPGQSVTVSFRGGSGENLQSPPQPK